MKEAKEIIDNIIFMFNYIIPGGIFFLIHNFIVSKKESKDKYFIFKSIIISFILFNFTSLIIKAIECVVKLKIDNFIVSDLLYTVITIVAAILISYSYSLYYMSENFKKLLLKIGINKSVHEIIWNDIIDLDNGTWILVYIPSEKVIYYGAIVAYEEKDGDCFILLSNYELKDYNYNNIFNYSEKSENCVAINTKNISRFEIFYDENSDKIPK